MSRWGTIHYGVDYGAPRVSGDEPFRDIFSRGPPTCSPRERG